MQIAKNNGAEAIKSKRKCGERDGNVLDYRLMRLVPTINRKRRCAAPQDSPGEQPAAQECTP